MPNGIIPGGHGVKLDYINDEYGTKKSTTLDKSHIGDREHNQVVNSIDTNNTFKHDRTHRHMEPGSISGVKIMLHHMKKWHSKEHIPQGI